MSSILYVAYYDFSLQQNAKYHKIMTEGKVFREKLENSKAALSILDIAGFKLTEDGSTRVLIHRNAALLNMVTQVRK
jgi:hypothetical protein